MNWPCRNVLSRFPGYVATQPRCEIHSAPTGNVTLQAGITGAQPALNADPAVSEAFVRPTRIQQPVLNNYIAASVPTSSIGAFEIGTSPIGWIASFHNEIQTLDDGADVEAPFGG